MGRPLPFLLAAGLLGGCAGNVADYIGPRSSIVSPQLIRYGLDLQQARCVGERIGADLTPLQLRLLARAAGAPRRGASDADRLTARDLTRVASSMSDPEIGRRLAAANAACGVLTEPPALHPAETAPVAAAPATSAPRPTAWLNLGSAGTGQSIAIDASTIEQDASTRTAWFRLTNPGAAAPTGTAYHLRIDCAARTIRSLAQRNGAGEYRENGPPDSNALPVESGTVMEIAWLALCT
jgi:hypothetical protein